MVRFPQSMTRFVAILGMVLLLAVPAATASLAAATSETGTAIGGSFREVARLAKQGRFEEAEALRQEGLSAGIHSPDDALFLQGLIALNRGDAAVAEEIFRRLLDADSDRRLVRLELVHALMARGSFTAARFHLGRLQGAETDRRLSAYYYRLDREITRQRPWGARFSGSLAPRTNASRGSSEDVIMVGDMPFRIDDEAKARSGVGFEFDGELSWQFLLSDTTTLTLAGFSRGVAYDESELGSIEVGGNATLRRFLSPRSFFDVGIERSRIYAGGDPYADNVTGLGAFSFMLLDHLQIATAGRVTHVDYSDHPRPDGLRSSGSVRATYAIGPGLALGAYVSATRDRSGYDHQRFDGREVGATLYAELPFSLTAEVVAGIGERSFDADYPGQTFARHDTYGRVSTRVLKRDWAIEGFAPAISLSYEIQDSNVAFKTYDDIGLSLGLARSF